MSDPPAHADNQAHSSPKVASPHQASSINRIARLFRSSSPRFRANLARTALHYVHYTEFLRGRMQDSDPRVRANLIESLWKIDTKAARDLIREAVRDKHHRVRTNALLGLCFLADSGAIESLIEQAKSSCPSDRAAAAWAMGQSAPGKSGSGRSMDERFTAILSALASDDTVEAVKEHARASLSALSAV